jgi:hypothetical protein
MKSANRDLRLGCAHLRLIDLLSGFRSAGSVRSAAFLVLVGLLAAALYLPSSASSVQRVSSTQPSRLHFNSSSSVNRISDIDSSHFVLSLLPEPQSPEAVVIYADDCVTPKTDFNLGELVCAKATGVPLTLFSWKVLWIDPAGFVERSDTAIADDQATYQFTLPSSATSFVNGQQVDNRGTWRVNLVRSNGAIRQSATFTVHEQGNPVSDAFVQKFPRSTDPVAQGGNAAFILIVGSNGPDAAAAVHLVDSVPSGSTLVSFSQQSGPPCTPAGANDCMIATLTNGERAEFTAIYNTGSTPPGTVSTSASVSSATQDPDTSNNNAISQFEIASTGGGSTCSIICPTSPGAVNNEPGLNGATIDWDGPNNDNIPVTSGDCGAVSVSTSSPHFFSIGVTPITVTTESGESCTFTVTVIDTENPNIGNCPANITVPEDSATPGTAQVNYDTPTATDNSEEVTVTCDSPSGSSFTVAGSPHTVTCTATDPSGNIDSCTFQVTVTSGSTECTLTPPADITATSNANQCGTNVTYQNPTQSGTSCGTVSCDRPSGSFFPVGTTVVTCNDTSGASTRFNVTVNDETAPVPNVDPLPTAQGQCRVTVNEPTATDNCGGTISGTTTDPLSYDEPGTYTVHWTYTDASGNTTNQNQTVIVEADTSPPVITACAANRTITADASCAVMPDMTGEIEATDNCTTVDVAQSPAAGTTLGSGDTTVTFTVTDNAGNSVTCTATVTVIDTIAPTITAPADSSASAGATCQAPVPDYTANSTTSDNCDSSLTLTQSPAAGTMVGKGTHTVTVTATDDAGNQASDEVVFTVNDTTAPVISCPANITQSSDPGLCSANINPGTATATDNCDTPIVTGARSDNQPLNAAYPVGTTTITWTAIDMSNNSASCTQTITVNDVEPPTITCPANITLEATCPTGAVATWTAPVGTDNCPEAMTSQTGGPASGSVFPIGTTTVTYSVTDAHGNGPVSCSFTVTVLTPQAVIQNLQAAVSASSLTGTQKNGLLAKLSAALQGINNGQTNVACNKLNDFINSVQNLVSHGDLPSATGTAWISSANHVRNTIGCTNVGCS